MRQAIILNARDNVATAVADLAAGQVVSLKAPGGQDLAVTAAEAIPYGHKFALAELLPGQPVIKYGEVIGVARVRVGAGAHVHVHNVESQRGRGDKRD